MDSKEAATALARFVNEMVGVFPLLPKLPEMIGAIAAEHGALPEARLALARTVAENSKLIETNAQLENLAKTLESRIAGFDQTRSEQERVLKAEAENLDRAIAAKRAELQKVTKDFEAFMGKHNLAGRA